MKYLFAGDLHGSAHFTKKMLELAEIEKVDKIILLGDIYYHGPRNGLSFSYEPMQVCEMLNAKKEMIECVQGNCDSEVDQTISKFNFVKILTKNIGGKKFFFSHGHNYNQDAYPSEDFDVMVYGHFHTPYLRQNDGKQFLCVGSVGIPKGGSKNCCVTVVENFDRNIIQFHEFE